jgi:hypothetical protein
VLDGALFGNQPSPPRVWDDGAAVATVGQKLDALPLESGRVRFDEYVHITLGEDLPGSFEHQHLRPVDIDLQETSPEEIDR